MAGEGVSVPTLVTLNVSHYCEKARWAFERYGIPYFEEAHAPGFHMAAVRNAGGRSTTPCLRLTGVSADATEDITESTGILRWVDRTVQGRIEPGQPALPLLFPKPADTEVARLCEMFDARLGPAVRAWAYSYTLYLDSTRVACAAPPVPALERVALLLGGWYVIRSFMAKGLSVSPEAGQESLAKIRAVFEEVDAMLADGRKFLVGDSFTAADLTFSALAVPALGQPYSVWKNIPRKLPEGMQADIDALRGTNAGKFALRMWEEERSRVL